MSPENQALNFGARLRLDLWLVQICRDQLSSLLGRCTPQNSPGYNASVLQRYRPDIPAFMLDLFSLGARQPVPSCHQADSREQLLLWSGRHHIRPQRQPYKLLSAIHVDR